MGLGQLRGGLSWTGEWMTQQAWDVGAGVREESWVLGVDSGRDGTSQPPLIEG